MAAGRPRLPWLPSTSSFNARAVLIGSWVASAAIVTATATGRLSSADAAPAAVRVAAGLLAFGAAAVIFARLQLRLLHDDADPRQAWLLLGLGLLPLGWASPNAAPAFGIAAALVCLDVRRGLVALALTGTTFLALYRDGGGLTQVSASRALLEVTVVGVVFAVLSQLALTLDRLQRARERLARIRVDRERERVAHDLHDLMGRTLVTASLRCQALLRVLGDRQPTVGARLARLQRTLSTGQERVRAVTSGPVISGWEEELDISRALCARVGIELSIREDAAVPAEHLHVAALALRESVTAALSHRRTGRVAVRLGVDDDGDSLVQVAHDGPCGPAEPAAPGERVSAAVGRAGGSITVTTEEGTWVLRARLPATGPVGAP